MNENLDLTKILKDCPKGTKLYSPLYGDVELVSVSRDEEAVYPIEIKKSHNGFDGFAKDGRLYTDYKGECMLFPSREERNWDKFKPKKKWWGFDRLYTEEGQILFDAKPKFDPKTLQPFDKVLIRDSKYEDWKCDIFSHIYNRGDYHFRTITSYYAYCIPYNEETKHLVGTVDEAPEYYRYWEE